MICACMIFLNMSVYMFKFTRIEYHRITALQMIFEVLCLCSRRRHYISPIGIKAILQQGGPNSCTVQSWESHFTQQCPWCALLICPAVASRKLHLLAICLWMQRRSSKTSWLPPCRPGWVILFGRPRPVLKPPGDFQAGGLNTSTIVCWTYCVA